MRLVDEEHGNLLRRSLDFLLVLAALFVTRFAVLGRATVGLNSKYSTLASLTPLLSHRVLTMPAFVVQGTFCDLPVAGRTTGGDYPGAQATTVESSPSFR